MGEFPRRRLGNGDETGDDVTGDGGGPSLPRLQVKSLPSVHAPEGGDGKEQQSAPFLGPPDLHLLAPKCHPSSSPLPATPRRAAAPGTAPAAGAWRHWAAAGRAQGTARGIGQRTCPGDSAWAWRLRRCTAPPPRHPSRPRPRAPRPRPAPRRPVSEPGPHCSREKTLQPGQPRAQLVPRVLSWPVLQPCPLTLRPRELVPTPFLPCLLRSLLQPALVTPATPSPTPQLLSLSQDVKCFFMDSLHSCRTTREGPA